MRQLTPSGFTIVVAGAVLAVAAFACHGAGSAQWTYTGKNGPAKWGGLEKEFADCKLGQAQAPIDIPDAATRKGDFSSLLFNYKPSAVNIVDDGHTYVVNYAPGSFVTLDGKSYELVQIDFHKPSEVKIDGKVHDMAAHLLHKGRDGKLAIIAVLLDGGGDNQFIKTVWKNMPREKGRANVVDGAMISALDLLPNTKGYYAFAGSLTTPPCTEGVTWFVLKMPVKIPAEAIAQFARAYPMNARPVQPLNGRDIEATR